MGALAVVPTRAAHDVNLRRRDIRLLITLSSFANKEGICWPGTHTLCELAGMARETVSRGLHALADRGYITIKTERQTERGRTRSFNVYRIVYDAQPDLFDGQKCDQTGQSDCDQTSQSDRDQTSHPEAIYGTINPHCPPEAESGNGPAVNPPDGGAGLRDEGANRPPDGGGLSVGCAPDGAGLSGGSLEGKSEGTITAESLVRLTRSAYRMRIDYATAWVTSCLKSLPPEQLHDILTDGIGLDWDRDKLKTHTAEIINLKARKGLARKEAIARPAGPPAADIEAWYLTLDHLRATMPASAFTWIRDVELAAPINGEIVLAAPTKFAAEQAEPAGDDILTAIQQHRPDTSRVKFTIRKSA